MVDKKLFLDIFDNLLILVDFIFFIFFIFLYFLKKMLDFYKKAIYIRVKIK